MKRLITILTLIFLTSTSLTFASDCKSQGHFLTIAPKSKLVALVKINRYLTFKNSNDKQTPMSMEVEIVNVYHGQEKRKTLTVWGDNGKQCQPYLNIFKADKYYVIAFDQESKENPLDFTISTCDDFWLSADIEKKIATGPVSEKQNEIAFSDLIKFFSRDNESINTNVTQQNSLAENDCPNQGRMDRLCQYIGNKAKDTTPDTDYNFTYQRIVYEAACVDYINDTEEEIAQKVNTMWNRFGGKLRCGPMGVPATGSPLRYAIHTAFNEFITEAISLWKLDLNKVENGMTMLDFLDDRISKSSGALKSDLENYRRGFLRLGAKKRSEL